MFPLLIQTTTLLCSMLLLFSYMLKKKMSKKKEKSSTFECGFDPNHKMRNPLSLRFFLISIMFLIFDVEIAIIFPFSLNSNTQFHSILTLNTYIFMLLMIGLLFEWSQGSFNWT